MVENLVKNWEVEASFKTRLQDWRTIDYENYTFSMNGGPPQSAEHMLNVGTYNAIIAPNEYYSPENSDFASSHKTFKRMMPTFAWEVIEVYSGPPKVAFKWRHWGVMKNDYVGFNEYVVPRRTLLDRLLTVICSKGEKVTAKAHGGPIEIFGITVANVDDKVRLQAVDTWMDPLSMFRQIAPYGIVNKGPMSTELGKADALDNGQTSEHDRSSNGNRQIEEHASHQRPEEVIEQHSQTSGSKSVDSFVLQDGGCPFGAKYATNGDIKATPNSTNGNPDRQKPTNGDAESHRELETNANDPSSREAIAHHDQKPDAMPLPSESLVPTPLESSASLSTSVESEESSQQTLKDITAEYSTKIGGQEPQSQETSMQDTDTLMADGDTKEGAEQAAEKIVGPHSTILEPPNDVPRSIYSSGVNGDVENTIKDLKSEDHVDKAATISTDDLIDQHLEHPVEQLRTQSENAKRAVLPDTGEAVVAPKDSKEARKTHAEMSEITAEEESSIMNRE